MDGLIKISEKGVNARDLYDYLEIKHHFKDWIGNSIRDYGFEKNIDFCYYFSESTGGRPRKEYAISINMAKELSMVAKTAKGREARKYFIKCEEILKKAQNKKEIIRLAGIETRKTLTDKIQGSGENERMHGFAYSSYTKLVYKLCGIEYKKIDNFRNTLTPEQLERVETVEKMTDALLSMGRQYDEIKNTLASIITQKAITA